MVLHMNTALVLILKLIKQDHFYFFGGSMLRGQHAECIHKPSRVRVVHYHYSVVSPVILLHIWMLLDPQTMNRKTISYTAVRMMLVTPAAALRTV
jgi:hypothetical protein